MHGTDIKITDQYQLLIQCVALCIEHIYCGCFLILCYKIRKRYGKFRSLCSKIAVCCL